MPRRRTARRCVREPGRTSTTRGACFHFERSAHARALGPPPGGAVAAHDHDRRRTQPVSRIGERSAASTARGACRGRARAAGRSWRALVDVGHGVRRRLLVRLDAPASLRGRPIGASSSFALRRGHAVAHLGAAHRTSTSRSGGCRDGRCPASCPDGCFGGGGDLRFAAQPAVVARPLGYASLDAAGAFAVYSAASSRVRAPFADGESDPSERASFAPY